MISRRNVCFRQETFEFPKKIPRFAITLTLSEDFCRVPILIVSAIEIERVTFAGAAVEGRLRRGLMDVEFVLEGPNVCLERPNEDVLISTPNLLIYLARDRHISPPQP
jgi:hypothetical protein